MQGNAEDEKERKREREIASNEVDLNKHLNLDSRLTLRKLANGKEEEGDVRYVA